MFNQDKQFRRPDGTPYDPSSFNIRQFEEHYGPGGVPEVWSMAVMSAFAFRTAVKRSRWLREREKTNGQGN
ncbi:hypothetical protein NMQ03_10900 [Arthrobacter sp. DNA4]|uniref:hypothetical protein n=1 Tax=Arthrobacter sp. DNA4 TaxID=2963432 RepID=UPI0020CF746A|nr:hypothetical protein [Arthrobacter sp. DNA4]UTT67827.1 hypothetical protein NMQ03_10900 [Arthrobacter sp. DNA4]